MIESPPNPAPVAPETGPRLIRVVLGLVVLCVAWAVVAVVFNGFDECLIFLGFSLVFAWPALAYFLIRRWGGQAVLGLPVRFVAIPGSLVGLVLLWSAEIGAIALQMHLCPPLRPMFHNEYVSQEWSLFPYWEEPGSTSDDHGHWVWADYRDNVIVVVATGVPVSGPDNSYIEQFASIETGWRESVIRVRNLDNVYVTLPRTRDVLVIILPAGTVGRFSLPEGAAEDFHRPRKYRGTENMLRDAVALLAPADRSECEAFLRGYTEPPIPHWFKRQAWFPRHYR